MPNYPFFGISVSWNHFSWLLTGLSIRMDQMNTEQIHWQMPWKIRLFRCSSQTTEAQNSFYKLIIVVLAIKSPTCFLFYFFLRWLLSAIVGALFSCFFWDVFVLLSELYWNISFWNPSWLPWKGFRSLKQL